MRFYKSSIVVVYGHADGFRSIDSDFGQVIIGLLKRFFDLLDDFKQLICITLSRNQKKIYKVHKSVSSNKNKSQKLLIETEKCSEKLTCT